MFTFLVILNHCGMQQNSLFFNNFLRIIQQREVDLVINLPNKNTKFVKENYLIRRAAVDYGIGVISNLQVNTLLCLLA